jgi:hypothetical protein
LVVAAGVDFDNKVDCSGAPALFLCFIDAWGSLLLEAGNPPDRFAWKITICCGDCEITGCEQIGQVSTPRLKSCAYLVSRGAALRQRCRWW